jgi:WD40 repeat protein
MLSRSSSGNRSERTGTQVTRRRRQVARTRLGVVGRAGRRSRISAAGATAVVLAGAGVTYASTVGFGGNHVGTQYANGIQVSSDQIIKPLGERLLTKLGKFMGSTVSPDGRFLAATSADKSVVLQIFDLKTYKLIWAVGTPSGVSQSLSDGTVGQEGPTYSPDGTVLWLAEKDGLTRFPVNAAGVLGPPTRVSIPAVNGHSALVGQTTYSPDGSTLYAALNGQNTVVALDPNTGAVNGFFQLRTATGDAPNPLWQFDGSVDLLTPVSPT